MITLFLLWLISATEDRKYYVVDLAKMASAGTKHTHVQVTGFVTDVRTEADGDTHIRLCDSAAIKSMDKAHCVIVECIPKLPCQRPTVKTNITVRGISRYDGEHGWWEVHPLESWELNKMRSK